MLHGSPDRRNRVAISMIQAEHRSLDAVLHGMAYLVRHIRYAGSQPQFDVLAAMIHYIDSFTERFHHPKEDRYLFRLLRLRYPPAGALLDRLQREHRTGTDRIETLKHALARYQEVGASEFSAFATAVTDYAAFHYEHMRLEETEIFPLAEIHLLPDDWNEIEAAFAGDADPLVGVRKGVEYETLFRRIVELTPAPLGAGRAG